MIEKGKITPYQLFTMITLFLFGSTTILRSLNIAGRNLWVSAFIALAGGLAIVWLIIILSFKFPGQTPVEYGQTVLGKVVGKIVALLYLWYFLHLGSLVMRNFGELLSAAIMPETPMWFFHLTLALVAAFVVYNQLEVLGRLSEIVFPFTIGLSLTTGFLVFLTGEVEWENLLPVLESGIRNIVLGSFPLITFPYGEVILFAMIIPYLNDVTKAKRPMLGGLIFAWIVLFLILVQDIALFGEYMASLTFPRFFAVRLISVGDFIERIEPVILAIWLMAGLVKIAVCQYVFVLGLAQLLNTKQYQPMIIPTVALMVTLADLVYKNIFEMLNFAINIYPVYALPFQVGFPLLILVVAKIRGKGNDLKKQKPQQQKQKQQQQSAGNS